MYIPYIWSKMSFSFLPECHYYAIQDDITVIPRDFSFKHAAPWFPGGRVKVCWKLNACIAHSSLSNSCGVKKSACLKIVRKFRNRNIQHGAVPEPENIFYVIAIFYSNLLIAEYDVEYIFGPWNCSNEDFCSYTRKRFSGKPIFFMSELLLD